MNNCKNVVRVFFRDRSWQVSVFVDGHCVDKKTFGVGEQLAVNYAIQRAQEYFPCLYEKLDIEGNLEKQGEV